MFKTTLATLLALAPGLAWASAPSLTTTHGLIKLQPHDAPPAAKQAEIAAASNEMESFQAVVHGGGSGLRGVSATISDLQGPTLIPSSKVVLYRADWMDVRTPSDANGLRGRIPDALIPDVDPIFGEKRNAFPFDVPAGELRSIWVDVHVPPETPAGRYQGVLDVRADGFQESIPVELEVFGFELPSTPSYATAFGFSWMGTGKAHCGDLWCNGDLEFYDHLRQIYAISALDNRLTLSAVAGIGVSGSNGELDFSRYDKLVAPLLNGEAPTRLPGAQLTSIQVWQQGQASAGDYAGWAKHFRDQGWFERLFDYTCDEPPLTCAWDSIGPRQRRVQEGDPQLKSLITTSVGHLKNHGLYESTDIIVPVVNFVEGKNGEYAGDQSGLYSQAREDGKTVWIYSSCMSHGCGNTVGGEYGGDPDLAGWPSLVIDHSALRNRAMPWVAYRFGFSGELYWDTVFALATKGDPWRDQYDFTGHGDGTLFYPGTPAKIGGKTHIPVESIRLKEIRDGIEDYEYLSILAIFDEAAAENYAKRLFPHAWSAGDIQPEDLLQVRRELAGEIARHWEKNGGGEDILDQLPGSQHGNGGGSSPDDPKQPKPGASGKGGGAAAGKDGSKGGEEGGGCSVASSTAPLALLGVLPLVIRRRRRS